MVQNRGHDIFSLPVLLIKVTGQKVANEVIELSYPFKVPASPMGSPNLLLSTKNSREKLHLSSQFTLRGEKKTGERTLRNTNYSIINDSFQSLGKLHS